MIFIRIAVVTAGAVIAPGALPLAEFAEEQLTDTNVVFANASHDFPQFVRYRRRGANELHGSVDRKMDGKDRRFESHYRRVACPR